MNRWRTDHVGLKPIPQAELPSVTKEVQFGATKGYRVDFRGPGGKGKGMPKFGGG